AQESKKIAKRGGEKTRVAIRRHRYDLTVLSLREFSFVRCKYQRQVCKFGRRHAKRFVDQDLLVRVSEVVLAADDMRDLHLDVIADDREVIKRMPVRSQQHEVFRVGVISLLQTVNRIFKRC